MAQFVIEIPQDKVSGVIDAFCTIYNYKDYVINDIGEAVPNTETKPNFVKRMILFHIRDVYRKNKVNVFERGRKDIVEQANLETEDFIVN